MYQTKVVQKGVPKQCLYQCTWLVEETTEFSELTICEGASVIAPEGKYLTLTVNGIGKEMKPGTYKGDVILSVTDNYLMSPHGLMRANQISRNFHTAICVENGKVVQAGVALGSTNNVDHWPEIIGLMMIQDQVDLNTLLNAENALTFFTIFNLVDGVWDETLPSSTSFFVSLASFT